MELKCLEIYRDPSVTLNPGDTTEGLGMSEEFKAQMLNDYPSKFEEIPAVESTPKETVVAVDVEAKSKKGKSGN